MKLFSYILTIVAMSITTLTFADTQSSPRESLLQKLNTIKSMTGSFIQIPAGRSAAFRKDVQGTFVLKKPGEFRWDIDRPSAQKWVTDGHTLWIEDIDLKQVTVQPISTQGSSSPLQLLSGDAVSVLNHYSVSAMSASAMNMGAVKGQGDACYDFKSLGHSDFQRVQLCFQQNVISWMRMTDNLNHTSIITFPHVQLNPKINPAVFQFKIPAGFDVIRRRA